MRYFQVVSDALICIACINYIRSKLKITCFLTNSVNRITGSYFFSVTGYDLLASFTALCACVHRYVDTYMIGYVRMWDVCTALMVTI